MCCNGALFYSVQLQPADSARELASLGIKLKRKSGIPCILQPCPAHRGSQCTIYLSRPERCRLFECRQIRRLATGESTEAEALEVIGQALQQVAGVKQLLEQVGDTSEKRCLRTRIENALVPQAEADPGLTRVRDQLSEAAEELETLFRTEFRT